MRIPPLFHWVQAQYASQPILTVVVGIGVLILALYLLRKAAKLFSILLLLLAVAILVSYAIDGDAKTRQRLDRGGRQAIEKLRESGILQDGQSSDTPTAPPPAAPR